MLRSYTRHAPYFLAYLVFVLSSYIWRLAAGRWLPQEDFGTLMLLISSVGMVGSIILASTRTYIARESARGRLTEGQAQALALGSAALYVLAILPLLPIFREMLTPYLTLIFLYALWSGPFTHERARKVSKRAIVAMLLLSAGLIFTALVVRQTRDPLVAVWAYMGAATLPVVLYRVAPDFSALRRGVVRRIATFVPITAGKNALINADTIMIGAILGASAVAPYRAAVFLTRPVLVLAEAVSFVLLPAAARSRNLRETMRKSLAPVAILGTLYALCVLALGPGILSLVYAGKYTEAFPVLLVLTIASVMHATLLVLNHAHIARDREAIVSRWLLVGAAVNVFLNVLFIPRLGILGAAIATSIGYAVADIPPSVQVARGAAHAKA